MKVAPAVRIFFATHRWQITGTGGGQEEADIPATLPPGSLGANSSFASIWRRSSPPNSSHQRTCSQIRLTAGVTGFPALEFRESCGRGPCERWDKISSPFLLCARSRSFSAKLRIVKRPRSLLFFFYQWPPGAGGFLQVAISEAPLLNTMPPRTTLPQGAPDTALRLIRTDSRIASCATVYSGQSLNC